jgi:hypothetical protein
VPQRCFGGRWLFPDPKSCTRSLQGDLIVNKIPFVYVDALPSPFTPL